MISQLQKIPNQYLMLLLCGIVFILYSPSFNYEFINLDDYSAVINNPEVQKGFSFQSLKWAFTTTYYDYWHPLTWLTHILDWNLYGRNAGGHHLTNVLFHSINTLLLFIISMLLFNDRVKSFTIALLFGIHPMHLESVVWIVERKDVMSMCFGLAAIVSYLTFLKTHNKIHYFFSILLFSLGLMSKPMLITFPFVLILLDFAVFNKIAYIKSHLKLLILTKVPFFFLSFFSAFATFKVVKSINAISSTELLPISYRVLNAIHSYFMYLKNFVFPFKTTIFHPYIYTLTFFDIIIPLFVLTLIFVFTILYCKKSCIPLIGYLWFLGSLVPVIGLVQSGSQAYADRYAYFPYIGLYFGIVTILFDVFRNAKVRILLLTVIFIYFAFLHKYQITFWRTTEKLFERSISINDNGTLIHNNLGIYYLEKNDLDKAAESFLKSVSNDKNYVLGLYNLGVVESRKNNVEKSNQYFSKVIEIDSGHIDSYVGILDNYLLLNYHDSINFYSHRTLTLLRKKQSSFLNCFKLAKIFSYISQTDSAIFYYQKSLEIQPNQWNIYSNLGIIEAEKGNDQKAMQLYYKALKYNANTYEPWHNILLITLKNHQYHETINIAAYAIEKFPNEKKFYYSRASAYGKLGMIKKMEEDLNTIKKIDPSFKFEINMESDEIKKTE